MNIETQNCQPDLIDSFLNGDLDLAQERQLTDHLEDCNACRLTLESTAAEPDGWMEAGQLLKPTKFDWNPEAEPDDLSNPIPLQIRNVLDSLTPSEDPQMLGQLGGYDVSGVVGAGAMGVVLKASDKSLDRTVAIKVLSPHLASSGAARKRFAREAKAAAAVLHANVIAIHGVSKDQSMPHLVMPYVRGTSLQKRINDDGSLPVNEVLRIGAQIAAGLAAAHAQGLVHRDIKPANILLEEGVERVAITDFGLARAVDDASLTRTGIIAGTPQYMSPEQSRGESVDQRSDLFSLGSVMYAMCVGRPPFRSETTYGVIQRINNDQPTPIREINPDVPDWLVTIVNKLMSKQATDRFESAQEVSELLEQCLAHVQQPSATPLPASLARSCSSRFFSGAGRKTGVIAVMIALGFGLLGMFLWQATNPPDITGKWHGDGWGEVQLIHQALGQYKGEYIDTFRNQPGTMELKWSRVERRFNGTWQEGKDRFGDVSLRHSDDRIFGAWTTSEKSKINPSRPKLADLQWTRPQAEKALEDFHARRPPRSVGAGKPDTSAAIKVADKFVTATLRGRKTEMESLLSPSHDPMIGCEFIEDMMPIVFGLDPKFTEAYVNYQDPDDMLLTTPTLAADKRIQGPVRLTFGMKREKDGWRVCEVLFPTPKELDNLIAFYKTGEPLRVVYRMERDLKMPGVPEELRLAKASLHTATKKLQIAEEQHSKEDRLEPLRLKVEAALKEFQRVQKEVQFRSARRIDLTSEAIELPELPSKDIVAKAKENINKVVTKMLGEQKTEREIQEKLREMLTHTQQKQEELRVQPEGTFGSLRSKLATLERVFRDEIQKRESQQPKPIESQKEAIKPLLGTWSLFELIANPHSTRPQRPHNFEQYDLTFYNNKHNAGHSVRLVLSDDVDSSKGVTLNSSTSPKEINIFGEGFLIQGIYECEGDTLKIAYLGKSENGRPSSLEATPESDLTHSLWIYKRNATPKADVRDKVLSEEPPEVSEPTPISIRLENVKANLIQERVQEIYDSCFSQTHGPASITATDSPNSLVVVGSPGAANIIQEVVKLVDIKPIGSATENLSAPAVIPAGAEVVDKRKEQREAETDDDSRVSLAPLLKENESREKTDPLLTTVEEVETHLRKVFEERKLLTNADVEFRLISDGDYSYNRRYHVWLNGENRRADSKGVSNNGRSDQTQILTPRYSFFEDRVDGEPQYSARDSKNAKKPVGWNGVSSVPDLRKFGLIAWNVESIQNHPWGKNLLNKVRHDVRVETGKHDGHPITIVKSMNKYDNEHGKFEGRNEYWLSPAHGNLPIYLETRTKLPDAEKRVVVMKQHVQWKQFDSVWFPQKIEYIYQITGKQDNKTTLDVTAARFNQSPFPNVFDPLDATK